MNLVRATRAGAAVPVSKPWLSVGHSRVLGLDLPQHQDFTLLCSGRQDSRNGSVLGSYLALRNVKKKVGIDLVQGRKGFLEKLDLKLKQVERRSISNLVWKGMNVGSEARGLRVVKGASNLSGPGPAQLGPPHEPFTASSPPHTTSLRTSLS